MESKTKAECSLWAKNVPLPSGREHVVQTRTLDDIASAWPSVHGVKIDAQGSEAAILAGAARTLARPETVWMLEVWPSGLEAAGSSLDALLSMLREAGLQLIGEGKEPRWHAKLSWEWLLNTPWKGQQHTNILCRH